MFYKDKNNIPSLDLSDIPKEVVDFYKNAKEPNLMTMLKVMNTVGTMFGDKEANDKELRELTNNIHSTLELIKQAYFRVMVAKGLKEADSIAIIETLTKVASIQGGVSFADFQTTENMARLAEGDN